MRYRIYFLQLALLCFGFVSCSSSSRCEKSSSFIIKSYTSGGFTGVTTGITIKCDGKVSFWEQNLDSEPVSHDSLEISSGQIDRITDIIQNNEIFNYHSDYTGNITAHLSITTANHQLNISYNPAGLPKDMPEGIKKLLNEIKKIHVQK